MKQQRLRELEDQCIQDCLPPCSSACPLHVNIRKLTLAVANGKFSEGYAVLNQVLPFPGIIAHTCDQPCQAKCNRETLGGVIRIADLERACVDYNSRPPAPLVSLPKKSLQVSVIGGGLSGLTAAYELSKKGYQVHLYEQESRLGGQLWNFSADHLPPEIIERETCLISRTGVDIHLNSKVESLNEVLAISDAIYLGTGGMMMNSTGCKTDAFDRLIVDPITFQTSEPKVFAGGSQLHPYSSIQSISDGHSAGISIDRFLQKVSITASRTDEGAYETRLFTSIVGIPPVEAVIPVGLCSGYSAEEAKQEGARCLQCECMECVKVCEYLKHYNGYPKKYIREIYNNLSMIKRTRTSNKFINSCTQCGLCAEVCPTNLDMGGVTREARQIMVNTNKMPASAHDFALRDMTFSNSDKFASILLPQGVDKCEIAFFPGCQLAASNPEYVPKITEALQTAFPNMGLLLGCCGAPAEWSGEDQLFQQLSKDFYDRWLALGEPELILACSSCNRVFSKILPKGKLISMWDVYQKFDLFPQGLSKRENEFVIHDPCSSRHEDVWQDLVRSMLKSIGISFRELQMSRNLTECCGYGGVAWLANPDLVKEIIKRRVDEDFGRLFDLLCNVQGFIYEFRQTDTTFVGFALCI